MAAVITQSDEVSHLLASVLGWLDQANIPYSVERNYAGYPEKITGDVDFVILPSQIEQAAEGIGRVAAGTGWSIYTRRVWAKGAYLGLYKPVFPGRFALTIELFGDPRWRGMTYLSAEKILAHRARVGVTWRPHPAHQAIITVVHHLLYNSHVPSKYREEVRGLALGNRAVFRDALAVHLGAKWAQEILDGILEERWDDLASNVKQYRKALILSSLKSPFSFLYGMAEGYLSLRRLPEGVSLLVESSVPTTRDSVAELLLEIANQWHLFLPPVRRILEIKPNEASPENQAVRKQTQGILRRGGVVISLCGYPARTRPHTKYPEYYIFCDSAQCSVKTISKGQSVEPIDRFSMSTPEQVAYQIWNVVLADRAKRL